MVWATLLMAQKSCTNAAKSINTRGLAKAVFPQKIASVKKKS